MEINCDIVTIFKLKASRFNFRKISMFYIIVTYKIHLNFARASQLSAQIYSKFLVEYVS